MPVAEAPCFEVLFRTPPQHRLVPVRSRSRGGLAGGTVWEHEEYDMRGQLVARFESFEETSPNGDSIRGWRRYDRAGHLVEARDVRPPATIGLGASAGTDRHPAKGLGQA